MKKPNPDGRYTVVEAGILRIEGLPGDAYLVTVLDVSRSDLRVSCSVGLPVGTRVEVQCRGMRVAGEIQYVRNVGKDEFHLGIDADDVSTGTPPEHSEFDLTLLFRRQ